MRAFIEGGKCFEAGLNIWSNPYQDGEAKNNWIRGYVAARKAITIGPYCEWPRTCYDGTCIWP